MHIFICPYQRRHKPDIITKQFTFKCTQRHAKPPVHSIGMVLTDGIPAIAMAWYS